MTDNTIKLISMIAGIIGGVTQAIMSSRELYHFAKENQSKTEASTNDTTTAQTGEV